MASPDEVKLPMASSLQQIVGALLFGSDRPLTVDEIRACLVGVAEGAAEGEETLKLFAEASPREIKDAIESMAKELSRVELGFDLVELNGGYRFQTQSACGRWVRTLLKVDRPNRLSRPALETLAIIAYRQPIAKSEIESIRGVMVDHIVKALMELHLIRIVGRSDLPGRPFLYGTTATFLDHFGLKNLKELNELDPTLQRSSTRERNAVHKKERKKEQEPDHASLFAPEQTRSDVAVDPSGVQEILGTSEAANAQTEALYTEEDAEGHS